MIWRSGYICLTRHRDRFLSRKDKECAKWLLTRSSEADSLRQKEVQICTGTHILFWIRLTTAEDIKKPPAVCHTGLEKWHVSSLLWGKRKPGQGQEPSLARSWGVWLCMVVEKHLPVPSGAARYTLEKGSHQQTGFSNIFRLSSPVKLICTYLLRFPYACSIYSVLIWSLCPARVLKTRHWIIFRLLLREPNVDLVISAL